MVGLRSLCISCCLVFGLSSAAYASFITINPNDYPLGTDLSHMFDGVTLSIISQDAGGSTFQPEFSPALVGGAWGGSSTDVSIGGVLWSGEDYYPCSQGFSSAFTCRHDWNLLEVKFDQPTDFVQVLSTHISDESEMFLYDTAGNLIWSWFTHGPTFVPLEETRTGHRSMNEIQRNQADISRMVYGGYRTSASATQITYHKVPVPSTLLLMSIGAFALIATKRRS